MLIDRLDEVSKGLEFFAFQALQHVPDGGVPFLVNAFRVEPN